VPFSHAGHTHCTLPAGHEPASKMYPKYDVPLVGDGDDDADTSVMNRSKQIPVSVWHLPDDPTLHLRHRGTFDCDGLGVGEAVPLTVDVTLIVGLGEFERLGVGALGVST
jgi:hypothetical protein